MFHMKKIVESQPEDVRKSGFTSDVLMKFYPNEDNVLHRSDLEFAVKRSIRGYVFRNG